MMRYDMMLNQLMLAIGLNVFSKCNNCVLKSQEKCAKYMKYPHVIEKP